MTKFMWQRTSKQCLKTAPFRQNMVSESENLKPRSRHVVRPFGSFVATVYFADFEKGAK